MNKIISWTRFKNIYSQTIYLWLMQKHYFEGNILHHDFANRPFFMVDHVTWKLEDTFFYIFMHSYSFKFLGYRWLVKEEVLVRSHPHPLDEWPGQEIPVSWKVSRDSTSAQRCFIFCPSELQTCVTKVLQIDGRINSTIIYQRRSRPGSESAVLAHSLSLRGN